jgi:biopolymer transport protein ExbD
MKFGTRTARRNRERITLNLASMIDIVFLLLIYFIVTATLRPPEDRLSTALQSAQRVSGAQSNDFRPQVVEVLTVNGSPSYRLGARVMTDRSALHEALTPLPKDAGLFIKVHDGVPVGFAVVAVQTGKDAGFEKVTYVPADAPG